jgi:hypothetical protein
MGWLRAILSRLACLFRPEARRVPVWRLDITLTPEGAKVWQQVSDPESPVGKPTHHRRRLTDGDPTPRPSVS